MHVFNSIAEYRQWLNGQSPGFSIGYVPTMGALHKGHTSLVERSKAENRLTVCSIFVNPTQFNNKTDYRKYPKTLEGDLEKLRPLNCDVVFAPGEKEMYPAGEDPTKYEYDFTPLDQVMEGKHRPGHFKGVGIIVSKLFEIIKPANAYFGEKDFQQLKIIERMVEIAGFNVNIIACPIERESDGLAMSSRNNRLTGEQRSAANFIFNALLNAQKNAGNKPAVEIKADLQRSFENHPLFKLDYVEIARSKDLKPVNKIDPGEQPRLFIAAFMGDVRLIDNMPLFP